MKKSILFIVLLFVISVLPVFALESGFDEGRQLIEKKISCRSLSETQLESIGEYYMEQMHPGAAHERMDAMIGEEGSEQLKQVHIQMARMLYCGERGTMPFMMSRVIGGGDFSMMGNYDGFGMMGNYSPFGWGFGFIFMILFWGAIIWLIVWLVRNYAHPKESATEILKKRFVKGEITKRQFEEIKKELNK